MTQTADVPETLASMPADSPITDDSDPIEPAAWFMAAQRGGSDRILAKHRRRPDGRCAECSVRALVSWPCTLANIAHRAKMISGGKLERWKQH